MNHFLQKIREKKAYCLLIAAIFLIIAGYVCTICFGSKTAVHLRKENAFVSNNELYFKLKLDSCTFSPYSIGENPSNILCYIHLQNQNLENHTFLVSLNKMGRFSHYKFFLKGYDKDLQGCTLLVTHDPIGTGLVYAGYILLALFITFIILSKDFIFRKLLKKLSLFLFFILLTENSFGAVPLNNEETAAFGRLSVAYNGRIAPFDSYARDYCKALNLTTSAQLFLDPQAATRTVLNIYLYPEDYPNLPRPQMRIFPQGQHWLTPEDHCSNDKDSLFIAKILWLFHESNRSDIPLLLRRGAEGGVVNNQNLEIIEGIGKFQQLRCAEGSIDIHRQKAELWYNRLNFSLLTIFILFISSILYSIIYIIQKRRKKEKEQRNGWRLTLLIVPLSCLLIDFIARFYITRHLPLHNTYDTLICISFFALITGIISQKRIALLTFISLLIACITALMAQVMGGQSFSATATSLVSPWLGVHVSIVMLSYTLFFIGFVISTISIFSIIIKKKNIDLQRLNILNQVVNILGICFLTIGIMLGSVWANCSWGSYWSWDPKETMALLTLLAYAGALVSMRTKIASRPLAYPILNILAFAFLLCTYFGVSAWFGGMHANY